MATPPWRINDPAYYNRAQANQYVPEHVYIDQIARNAPLKNGERPGTDGRTYLIRTPYPLFNGRSNDEGPYMIQDYMLKTGHTSGRMKIEYLGGGAPITYTFQPDPAIMASDNPTNWFQTVVYGPYGEIARVNPFGANIENILKTGPLRPFDVATPYGEEPDPRTNPRQQDE